jgi:putative iron-only hydrogenase system regulator
METRVALIGIMVENNQEVENLNSLLSQYSQYIIGRMGIPYHQKGVSIISIAMDGPADEISALSGKIGRLSGISAKVIYQKTATPFNG